MKEQVVASVASFEGGPSAEGTSAELSVVCSASPPWTSFAIVKQDAATALLNYVFTILMLPVVLPLLAIFWTLIKCSAPRESAFFAQTRYGLGGKPFTMYKLRTMVPNAEAMKSALIEQSVDKGPGFKIVNDPRVTGLGRFFRKSHLDELPQLLNVLRGDMALVGPRANSYNPESYEAWQLKRLSVKPGVTGSWQVAKIKPVTFDERCRMDIEYIDRRSIGGDMGILLKTVFVCLFRGSGC